MPSNSKEIKQRIRSIRNIGQITKAMELTSAAKMRKAQVAATASRPYSTLSGELLRNLLSKTEEVKHPLLNRVLPEEDGRVLPMQKVLIVLISSDRGLAGAFNSNVVSKAVAMLKNEGAEKFDFITIGKKGADAIRRMGYNIVASFPAKDKATILDAQPIAEIATQDFLSFKYEKVFIVYTDFVSTLVQKPNVLQLLPFDSQVSGDRLQETEFLFEPSPEDVLETLVTRTIEFEVYQTLVEALASEHSARMIAMRNANEAAGDLIQDLSLSYNQARQAGITRELSEISAAKLAMEG
jgi:F-type H+-transporting ATPase subunit gamma